MANKLEGGGGGGFSGLATFFAASLIILLKKNTILKGLIYCEYKKLGFYVDLISTPDKSVSPWPQFGKMAVNCTQYQTKELISRYTYIRLEFENGMLNMLHLKQSEHFVTII